jgi:hypothetical protein
VNVSHLRRPHQGYLRRSLQQEPQFCGQAAGADVNPDDLIGGSNETSIAVEGIPTQALPDTGSSVSTVCESFYKTHLRHLELNNINGLIKVECADGSALPYLGFVQAEISVPILSLQQRLPCLLLVVPDTRYNSKTPVLLGTNFLSKVATDCRENSGPHYVQRLSTQTTWHLALRCFFLRERQLAKNQNCVAVVRCAESAKKTLLPNESIIVKGVVDRAQPYQATCALLQPIRYSYEDLDLAPTLVSYNGRDTGNVDVTFHNLSTRTVTINPRFVLCGVQPVEIRGLSDEGAGSHLVPSQH